MSQTRLKLLFSVVQNANAILILPHNDPDPDAIAGVVALRYLLAQKTGIEATIAYQGIIGRAENRAMVRYLDYPLKPLEKAHTDPVSHVIFVDTQPGTGNNPWTPDMQVTAVIDHHPWQAETAHAAFFDVRSNSGSASTILTEYLQDAGLKISSTLATALFYGIKTDTRGLSREVSQADKNAYYYLQPHINPEALADIERAQVSAAYFKVFADTLAKTHIYDHVTIALIETMDYPDMAAEMADLLARLENVEWVVCMGQHKKTLFLAVRAPGRTGDAGKVIQHIVRQDGSAGGHGTMAGGQVPLQHKSLPQLYAQLKERAFKCFNISPNTIGQPLI